VITGSSLPLIGDDAVRVERFRLRRRRLDRNRPAHLVFPIRIGIGFRIRLRKRVVEMGQILVEKVLFRGRTILRGGPAGSCGC
jgi:hypothetical protein